MKRTYLSCLCVVLCLALLCSCNPFKEQVRTDPTLAEQYLQRACDGEGGALVTSVYDFVNTAGMTVAPTIEQEYVDAFRMKEWKRLENADIVFDEQGATGCYINSGDERIGTIQIAVNQYYGVIATTKEEPVLLPDTFTTLRTPEWEIYILPQNDGEICKQVAALAAVYIAADPFPNDQ